MTSQEQALRQRALELAVDYVRATNSHYSGEVVVMLATLFFGFLTEPLNVREARGPAPFVPNTCLLDGHAT